MGAFSLLLWRDEVWRREIFIILFWGYFWQDADRRNIKIKYCFLYFFARMRVDRITVVSVRSPWCRTTTLATQETLNHDRTLILKTRRVARYPVPFVRWRLWPRRQRRCCCRWPSLWFRTKQGCRSRAARAKIKMAMLAENLRHQIRRSALWVKLRNLNLIRRFTRIRLSWWKEQLDWRNVDNK